MEEPKPQFEVNEVYENILFSKEVTVETILINFIAESDVNATSVENKC